MKQDMQCVQTRRAHVVSVLGRGSPILALSRGAALRSGTAANKAEREPDGMGRPGRGNQAE